MTDLLEVPDSLVVASLFLNQLQIDGIESILLILLILPLTLELQPVWWWVGSITLVLTYLASVLFNALQKLLHLSEE